jgi:hypothetical protein
MIGVFKARGSGEDAFNFYKNSSALTVSNVHSAGTGSSFVGTLQLSGSHTGSVTVADVDNETLIVVYLTSSTG